MSDFKKISLIAIGGAAVVAAGTIGASAFLSRSSLSLKSVRSYNTEKTVKVKGVAEKEIVSDLGAFSVSVSCKAAAVAAGYTEINRIKGILDQKLRELNIAPEWVENESISYSPQYKEITTKEGSKIITQRIFTHYSFTRSCRIISSDVQCLEKAALQLYDLISGGIDISISDVQYFISNPEQYKLELVDAATKSAYERAKTVADVSGAKLGPLLTGRQGVIQITRKADNDTSDYGVYDTSSIKKIMRMVVTLEFSLK